MIRSNRGFTLAEVLVAFGILIIVLGILSFFLTYFLKSMASMERLMTAQGENLIASRQLWFDLESGFPSFNYVSQPGVLAPDVGTDIKGDIFYYHKNECVRKDCKGPVFKLEKDGDQFLVLYTDQRWKTSLMSVAANFDGSSLDLKMADLISNIKKTIDGTKVVGRGLRGVLLHTAMPYITEGLGLARYHQILLEILPDPNDSNSFKLGIVQSTLGGKRLYPNTHPLDATILNPSDETDVEKSISDFFKTIPTIGSNVAVYVRPVGGAIYTLQDPAKFQTLESGLKLVRRDLFQTIRGDTKVQSVLLASRVKSVSFSRPNETIKSVNVDISFTNRN